MAGCGFCHECGTALISNQYMQEEYCPKCGQNKRYRSHGWGFLGDGPQVCPPRVEMPEDVELLELELIEAQSLYPVSTDRVWSERDQAYIDVFLVDGMWLNARQYLNVVDRMRADEQ